MSSNPGSPTTSDTTPVATRAATPVAGHKVTVAAPSNIALVKYWGAADLERALPVNFSFSMTLTECTSRSTVELLGEGYSDEIFLVGDDQRLEEAPDGFRGRIQAHLERLRSWGVARGRPAFGLRVATRNTFPAAAGLASSASGFAALTFGVTRALGFELETEELSDLARQSGSGSAARSVLGGYVQWPTGDGEEGAYAHQVFPPEHWALADVIAVIESGPKEVSSLEGHRRAPTSPHFPTRLDLLPARLEAIREAVRSRDFDALAPRVEEEAIELHLIAMSSRPPVFYWRPGTVEVLGAVRAMRESDVPAASTMDAGANVHVLCPEEAADEVARRLESLSPVDRVIRDRVGPGPRVLDEHYL
jgi:diphosphomevalonate decarboxylase